MKRILIALILILSGLTILAACSSSGPEAAAKKSMTALKKGDYAAFASTYDASSTIQEMIAEAYESEVESKEGIKSFKITSSSIDGNEAKVHVHVVFKDQSEEDMTLNYKLVNGEWLGVYSSK